MGHTKTLTALRTPAARIAFRFVLFATATLAAGCVSVSPELPESMRLVEIVKPDPARPGHLVDMSTAESARGVTIVRGGQSVAIRVPMDLQQGDELEVRAPASATLSFPGGHTVILRPDTRVRLGSISLWFGELIVKARGYFRVETEYWTAGVKGTEFSASMTHDKIGKISVVDGSIGLKSRTSSWPEVDVGENEVATMEGDAPPTKALLRKAQVDAIRTLINRTMRPRFPAPRPRPY